jgi:imidazolonepropionase-like amidohydrolase
MISSMTALTARHRASTLAAVAAAASLLITPSASRPLAQNAATAFIGVSVLPMDKEGVLADQTVVVADGRIATIAPAGKAQVPAGAVKVDGKGKYLMPGLGELHAHIPGGKAPDGDIERTLFLYVANGVTTIRGMLGDPRHLVYRERVARGEVLGPRIYTSGPSFSGNTAKTPDTAVTMVVEQHKAGYDLLKIHPGVPRDAFDAMAAKAGELKIPLAGHVPEAVGLARALEAKYRSIDHLDGYVEALVPNASGSQTFGVNLVGKADESRIPALVKATRAAGTWQVPTEILLVNWLNDEDPHAMAKWPEMKYVDPGVLAKFSAHRELGALVAAGLTPYEALKSGTANVGVYFGTQSTVGTVAAGKRADLILLDANPLTNIANSSRIAGVMVNGRWLSKADIDTRLAGGK